MDVHIIPALSDNYMYLVVDRHSREAAIVDPVEPGKVMEAVVARDLILRTILTTHHHWDHAGGNRDMARMMGLTLLQVIGGDDRIDSLTRIVGHGDKLSVGRLQVECLHTPCHTRGHICYKITAGDDQQDIALFTGDTLFVAGCGKFLEGNGQQMYNALVNIIGKLPEQTKIYCGHEYTLNNLKFAKHVEPNNLAIDQKIRFAEECKQIGVPTIPSTVEEEKTYNPFMRVNEPTVQEHVGGLRDPAEVMAALRREKDHFKP